MKERKNAVKLKEKSVYAVVAGAFFGYLLVSSEQKTNYKTK